MTRMTRMTGVTEPEKKARKSHQPASDKHQPERDEHQRGGMSIGGRAVAGARAAWTQLALEPDEHQRSPGGQLRALSGRRTSISGAADEHHEHQLVLYLMAAESLMKASQRPVHLSFGERPVECRLPMSTCVLHEVQFDGNALRQMTILHCGRLSKFHKENGCRSCG